MQALSMRALPLPRWWRSAARLPSCPRKPRRRRSRLHPDMTRGCRNNGRLRLIMSRWCPLPNRFPGATSNGYTTAHIEARSLPARSWEHFPVRWLHPSRRGQRVRAKRGPMINSVAAPPAITAELLRKDEVLNPHGEEHGYAARLEPRGRWIRRRDSTQVESALAAPGLARRRRTAEQLLQILDPLRKPRPIAGE
jgi:hypothetical protein